MREQTTPPVRPTEPTATELRAEADRLQEQVERWLEQVNALARELAV